jgi:hypothetical protein
MDTSFLLTFVWLLELSYIIIYGYMASFWLSLNRFKPPLIEGSCLPKCNKICIEGTFNCIRSFLKIIWCFWGYYLFYFFLEMHQSSNQYFPSITYYLFKWILMIVLTKLGPSNAICCVPFNSVLDQSIHSSLF